MYNVNGITSVVWQVPGLGKQESQSFCYHSLTGKGLKHEEGPRKCLTNFQLALQKFRPKYLNLIIKSWHRRTRSLKTSKPTLFGKVAAANISSVEFSF